MDEESLNNNPNEDMEERHDEESRTENLEDSTCRSRRNSSTFQELINEIMMESEAYLSESSDINSSDNSSTISNSNNSNSSVNQNHLQSSSSSSQLQPITSTQSHPLEHTNNDYNINVPNSINNNSNNDNNDDLTQNGTLLLQAFLHGDVNGNGMSLSHEDEHDSNTHHRSNDNIAGSNEGSTSRASTTVTVNHLTTHQTTTATTRRTTSIHHIHSINNNNNNSTNSNSEIYYQNIARLRRIWSCSIKLFTRILNILFFATLFGWCSYTVAYLFTMHNECDLDLISCYWLVTSQGVFAIFRNDFYKCAFHWNPRLRSNNGAIVTPPPPRGVTICNTFFVIYSILVIRFGIYNTYLIPKDSECPITNQILFFTAKVFITLKIVMWFMMAITYIVQLIIAIAVTRIMVRRYNIQGADSSGGSNGRTNTGESADPYDLFFRRLNGSPPDCINQMRVILYEELSHETIQEGCCICMVEFVENEEIVGTECSHMFHKQCCEEWLKYARTCPVCRTDIPNSINNNNIDNRNNDHTQEV